ncbi:Crp/Fnr family transcriptional regulator [Clostridium pasteurianum]|uniref:Crp/Fnr family transcriptional regulator n=1 Tax=Clostridium pasteurianum TaxID=1501 RepID=UPI001F3AEE54|nr:Crp/Fnr family transcriptional regulator [Clostridium pasteurianum]UZW13911.1 Crp/Fnr family transcriptional regulator [Clostridium pasteurianum]
MIILQNSLEILKNIPIFSHLSEEVLQKIIELQNIKKYKKGEIIFYEGDKGEAFFFVKSGKVKIYKTSFDGRDITLNILGEGSIFAEVTLFNDINYPATVEVLENSEIGMILNKDIEKMILNNTILALQIIKVLTKRLYRSQKTLKEMAFSDTYNRISRTLLDLCERHGKETELGIEIDINITRQDIANMVGTSRETVSRIISELKKENILDTYSKKIIIIDKSKLRECIDEF